MSVFPRAGRVGTNFFVNPPDPGFSRPNNSIWTIGTTHELRWSTNLTGLTLNLYQMFTCDSTYVDGADCSNGPYVIKTNINSSTTNSSYWTVTTGSFIIIPGNTFLLTMRDTGTPRHSFQSSSLEFGNGPPAPDEIIASAKASPSTVFVPVTTPTTRPTDTDSSSSSSNTRSSGLTAGVIVGVILGIILVLVGVCCLRLWRRRRRAKGSKLVPTSSDSSTSSPTEPLGMHATEYSGQELAGPPPVPGELHGRGKFDPVTGIRELEAVDDPTELNGNGPATLKIKRKPLIRRYELSA